MRISRLSNYMRQWEPKTVPSNRARVRYAASSPAGYLRVKRKPALALKVRLRHRTVDLKVRSLAAPLPFYRGYPQLSAEYVYESGS